MNSARKIILATCATSLILFANLALAEGDPERGKVLANTCMGCHGIKGYRNAYPSYRVPMLGGQQEEYLVLSLQGYKNESRAHLTMQAQAATLSDQDMRDIASFLVSQGDLETGSARSNGQITRGKEKAVVCSACHGQNGVSAAPNWPTLAGQHEDYLVEVLNQYKNGERKDAVMAGQVVNLTSDDMEDLAAYYAAQPGLFTADYTGK